MEPTDKQIVTIGGGSGQFILLSSLRNLEEIEITAIVSMMDSGGSTGRLRDELGILPPGDILKCILALSPYQDACRSILLKRFKKDRRLSGHSAGNMLLTMLSRYTGSFPAGVAALAEILEVDGRIMPVTTDKATLVAELTSGQRIYGEEAIDLPRGTQREKIRDVFLVPHHQADISAYPPVIDAIEKADYIFIGPGDLFTSIIPNLIIPGVKEALVNTSARIYFTVNIMTKYGETHQFTGKDFVMKLEDRIGRKLDGILANNEKPSDQILDNYAAQKSAFVTFNKQDPFWEERTLMTHDILDTNTMIVRHDPNKLGRIIAGIIGAS